LQHTKQPRRLRFYLYFAIPQQAGGKENVQEKLKTYPNNRLVRHLAENCALTYFCPAARNYFLSRWECPVPVSPACNASCIGCISLQPDEVSIPSTQDRLNFKPTAEEIAAYTVPHLQEAPYPIVSFGQGCEGEPLLMWRTIRDAIRLMRSHTHRGCINLNTNGSKPDAVKALCEAGLNSIRVSMNSARREIYQAYYRPRHYAFEDVVKSLITVKEAGGWTSINYFVFPGMTDQPAEFEALCKLVEATGLDMIQWRNFNIDPDWYLKAIQVEDTASAMGMKKLLEQVRAQFPHLKFGYYNPPMERIKGNFETDFAHA
jgi:MoaA/NifB/PqqE/SkfB family radical SAM enzyme